MANRNRDPRLLPGTLHETREGCVFEVVEYNRRSDILVKCGNYYTKVQGTSLLLGNVKNPYHRSVYGVGFLGVGDFKPSSKGRHFKSYRLWKGMLERCYSGNYETYKDCEVCEKWHCYQQFCKDLPLIEGFSDDLKGLELDKDLKSKGNKKYSLETCCFITKSENVTERNKRCSKK